MVKGGVIDVQLGGGGVLHVNGVSALSELIMEGLLLREDRVESWGVRLDEVDDLAWAFAAAGDPAPYESYGVARLHVAGDDEDKDDDEEEERFAEQPETD